MNQLYRYIAAVQLRRSVPVIVEQSHDKQIEQDDEVEICRQTAVYTFADGVCLRKCTEEDSEVFTECVCQECWIAYDVIHHPADMVFDFERKQFTNACQESFWLKMQELQHTAS